MLIHLDESYSAVITQPKVARSRSWAVKDDGSSREASAEADERVASDAESSAGADQ